MTKYCKIKFSSSANRLYDYFVDIDDLEPNDIVIVEAKDKLIPAYFFKYMDYPEDATKWVIDRFDPKVYEKKKELIYNKEKLRKELENEIKSINEDEYLKALSNVNPNIKLLYETLRSLEGE